MKKDTKKIKIAAVAIIFLFIGISAVPAVVAPSSSSNWEDDFLDESKIDKNKSHDIEVINNKVVMKNTNKAWHYPWPKMKEITIVNSGSEKSEYVLYLEGVVHESEMQPDYSDIRFVNVYNDVVYDLDYWVGTDYDTYHANIWVRVSPKLPSGTSKIYMFYGDKNALPHSNFDMIFRWDDRTDPDLMISYKKYTEGAWDPDVAYGGGRFLVAWEERLGPEDLPEHMERAIFCVIHGRTYNTDGGDPQPPPTSNTDIDISDPAATNCHKENPSVAYGDNKFFVAWEENPATIAGRYAIDIGGALVTPSGTVSSRFLICGATLLQADPCVAFGHNRFFVAWEDARLTTNNYDVWGRIYDSNGNPIGGEIQITSDPNYQGEVWVCSDDQGFMAVYESGNNPEIGPFSLYAQKFDANGIKIGSARLVASGSDTVDYNFPSVCYNPTPANHGRYFIAWNDGDLSSSDWRGNIWGKTLNLDGSDQYPNFIVQQGDHYIRSDVAPFLGDMFFVTFDGATEVYGKLIYSNQIYSNAKALSDASSQQIDWNNLAVSDQGTVMVVWEDERDMNSNYADSFGSVWHIYKSGASSDVSYTISAPKVMTKTAVLMSTVISTTDVQKWVDFTATYNMGLGSIVFDVMNEQGTSVLHSGLGDISGVSVVPIRLRAQFSRNTPDINPYVDKWGVSYIGKDSDPPETHLTKNPASPNGNGGWYTCSVAITLLGLDGQGSGVETINYKIDGGSTQTIQGNQGSFTIWNSGTHTIEYWSVDKAGNTESHKFERDLKIDTSKPTVSIVKPEEFELPPGDIAVEAKVTEKESGIAKVQFYVNGEVLGESFESKETYYFQFTAEGGMFYTLVVKAYDKAGSSGEDSKDIQTTSEDKNKTWGYGPKIGYWYSSTESDSNVVLLILSWSLVVQNNLILKIKPPEILGSVSQVTFTITRKGRPTEGIEYTPNNDGYFVYSFNPPTGFYDVKAKVYKTEGGSEDFIWPGKVLFINTV
jgi:hypothetical protein